MTVQVGKDYAVAKQTTWVFETGVGKSTALITPGYVFVFPHRAIGGRGNKVTTSEYTIGGRNPVEAILDLLTNAETTPESLETQLLQWSKEVKGPIADPLTEYKRVRIFTGWLRRNVVLSKKAKGYDIHPTGIRPSKEETPSFVEFLKEHHSSVEIK